ncbi:glycoside hydrolase family 3 N-terminal domain-containing protein [Formosa sp. PL04]|uniref:glycoside hydrolase family 3 N-terminal domain-containing protein n=1 Tax=Formosa sp. PL04 TaxID=3081755 RepID=UPI0029814109|nr:glycoside hydrolase family 3 N-terminal domain-containing protein [Formosa sp. PL04]MDW5290769.1 glycoside hydrolase family 3 N-terminal domain-containing protein [Formosa sp. PL04]
MKKYILIATYCIAILFAGTAVAQDRTALHESATKQAKELVSQMTLEEKVNLIEMTSLPIERLDIPGHHWWNEALHGVARRGEATQFPVPLSMASTWNPPLIKDMTIAVSDEARALNNADSAEDKAKRYHGLTLWSPVINMARDPRWGRTEETYGEDPFLTTELACAFVDGLQGDDPNYLKTVATVKHFVVNNTEHNRLYVRPDVSERALREYYFPAYRDVIAREDVESIMTAYNGLNGIPCSANKWLLTDILRDEWGFNGTVVTDVGVPGHMVEKHKYAKNGAEAAAMMITAGVDMYSGSDRAAEVNEREWSKQAVEQGLMKESDLDQAITRNLATRIKLGLLRPDEDNPYTKISTAVIGSEGHLEIARQIALEGAVLLQNNNDVLPATPEKYKTILFAGPYVNDAPFGAYSGNAAGIAATPMFGMQEIAGDRFEIKSQLGGKWLFIPEGNLNLPGKPNTKGVKGEYFEGTKLEGSPISVRTDRGIDLDLPKPLAHIDPEIPQPTFSVRWTSELTPNRTGLHYFSITAFSGARVWINDEKVLDNWHSKAPDTEESQGVFLEEGKVVSLKVEYYNSEVDLAQALLKWVEPQEDVTVENPEDKLLIYVGGLTRNMSKESHDRMNSIMPEDQIKEIKVLAAIYPNMLVVLNGGTVMQLSELNEVVPAILLQWFPGQEGGFALAELITGQVSPSGHLPLTFYTDPEKLPDFEDYEISKGRTYMYMKDNVTYPFGYGLSYTSFDYSGLKVTLKKKEVTAVLDVKNTGVMDGDDVVQLYVTNLDSEVYQPIRQLKAFKRVTVPKGKTEQVALNFSIDDMAWWDVNKQKYVVNPGRYEIQIGKSSTDIVEKQIITVK